MIDLNDFKHVSVQIHGKIRKNKLYKHTCDKCGSDKGYQSKSYRAKHCNKCVRKGSVFSNETKQKMSVAATMRYNNLNWVPKDRSKKGHDGNKNRNYIVKNTPTQRKLKHRMKSLLWQKLIKRSANKSGSTFDILGYTVDNLIKHLESQFEPGMTWDNYGLNGWEIDHITPDSWFNYSSVEDQGFKDSWKLSNLRPTWADQNRSKGARYASCGKS
jgi:hypothetical protein